MESYAHTLSSGIEEYQEKMCGCEAHHDINQICTCDCPIRLHYMKKPAPVSLEENAAVLLEKTTGLDTSSEHGRETPKRFASMLKELTSPEPFTFTSFDAQGMQDMIVVQNIPFTSLCNHHVVPFVGYAHVAYVPDKKMAGLSKFARAVRYQAKRLQVQEQLTNDVADMIEEELEPLGVGVIMKAEHMCMTIRGVQTPGTLTTTSTMRGVFGDHTKTAKQEFMQIIGQNH